METSLEDWQQPSNITIEQLDEAVCKLSSLERDYEEKKKISNEANAVYETQRTYLLNLLQSAGKTKFHVDGMGTVSVAIKAQVKTPKDPDSKKQMIEYFQSLRPELFYHYVSVNHMTLNSYVNEQLNTDPDFVMPGVGAKTETPELRFRKEK